MTGFYISEYLFSHGKSEILTFQGKVNILSCKFSKPWFEGKINTIEYGKKRI